MIIQSRLRIAIDEDEPGPGQAAAPDGSEDGGTIMADMGDAIRDVPGHR